VGPLRNTMSGAEHYGATELTLCEARTWQSSRGETSV